MSAAATPAGTCPPPDLAVVVVQPTDKASELHKKVFAWLDAGTRLVWVIHPRNRLVHCYDGRDPNVITVVRDGGVVSGEPVLPGFAVPVADLFKLPAPPAAPGG
jgi:Uma2 family endonuclease